MKNILLSLAVVSNLVFAADLKPAQSASPVRVDSVSTQIVGSGFPVTEVKVQATFANKCLVPSNEELINITQYDSSFDTLVLTLGNMSRRNCPMVYAPVTVTIDLGQYARPNDGLFSKILVNGVEAK